MNDEKANSPVSSQPGSPVVGQPSTDPKPNKGGGWRDTASTIGVIILAPIVALFLTQFVFQSYQVDGPSMETTLQNGDRLIVAKTGKTWARLTGKDYIPKRYDIIIFDHSGEFTGSGGQETKKQLVKRVIGLPGDRVSIKDGMVKVFNSEHPDGYLIDREEPAGQSIGFTDNGRDTTVNEGEVFVLGDNRANSLDSRSFGTVSSDDIAGTLVLRIYPFDKTETF